MDIIKQVAQNANCTAVSVGKLNDVLHHSYIHPALGFEIKGKVFLGKALDATGVEMSVTVMPPKAEVPFLHTHNENEEIYIFLSGKGEFIVDDTKFEVSEGSVVRVAPAGKRKWSNTSDEPMKVLVLQVKANSLTTFDVFDGKMLK